MGWPVSKRIALFGLLFGLWIEIGSSAANPMIGPGCASFGKDVSACTGRVVARCALASSSPDERPAREEPSRTRLGIAGTRFRVNGKSTFLLGISYYAALGASDEFLRRDLDAMKRAGFRWLRIWATWDAYENDVSAVDGSGHPRQPYLDRLRRLVALCDQRGLVVDVTLTRGNGATPHLSTQADMRRAVETVVTALRPYRNWYLDLANERNVGDKRFVSFEELRDFRDVVRRLDPARPVTASHGGDIDREELRRYLFTARVDFVCPHRPREAGSAAQTEAKTREYLAWMRELGRVVPVHYQEPFRRGYGDWQPRAADFAADLAGARAGGAAGWCFHNGGNRQASDGRPRRSFDLRDGPLFTQLDEEEHSFVQACRSMIDPGGFEFGH